MRCFISYSTFLVFLIFASLVAHDDTWFAFKALNVLFARMHLWAYALWAQVSWSAPPDGPQNQAEAQRGPNILCCHPQTFGRFIHCETLHIFFSFAFQTTLLILCAQKWYSVRMCVYFQVQHFEKLYVYFYGALYIKCSRMDWFCHLRVC